MVRARVRRHRKPSLRRWGYEFQGQKRRRSHSKKWTEKSTPMG